MNFSFSNGLKNLSPSAIREILKYASDPEVVSLSAGNPSPEAFPAAAIGEICACVFQENPIGALQYSLTEGYPALRERLRTYMHNKHRVGTAQDELIITSGAQQVMGLVAKVLCNPGDVVICESPSFVGSLNSFRSLGARLVGVPMQPDGMDLTALQSALDAHPNAKFIYTIPNFQNPSGITMSMEKRRRLYALAKQYGVLIVEDNPYGDLRYAGESVPAVKSLDEDGVVLYAGSFSKVLSPGLRVGYAIGPAALLQKMVVAKQGEDVHTSILPQIICDEFMGKYDFEQHLQKLRELYREKAARMTALLDAYLVPAGITYQPIEGGLFMWCTLPDGVNMPEFCVKAVKEHKVAVVPGTAFLADETASCQNFRVNFSTPTDEAMELGVRRLGAFAKNYIKG